MASTACRSEPCAVIMIVLGFLPLRCPIAAKQLEAVHARHLQVGDDDVVFAGVELGQPVDAVDRFVDGELGVLEDAAQRVANGRVVVDDQCAEWHAWPRAAAVHRDNGRISRIWERGVEVSSAPCRRIEQGDRRGLAQAASCCCWVERAGAGAAAPRRWSACRRGRATRPLLQHVLDEHHRRDQEERPRRPDEPRRNRAPP